jgi:diguanylate cyclase (GGDEF)-like protein
MSDTDLLTRVSIFQGIDPADRELLAAAAEVVRFDAGAPIVEIGEPGRSLFVIIEGSVRVLYPGRNSNFELARLGPGDFFGEMAILNDKPRSATVRAQTAVRALRLGKDAFERHVAASPELALRILEVLSVRVRSADEHIGALSDHAQRDALTRLLNRRALQDRMEEECDRFRRYDPPFSLLLLDLDHFRDLNEMFGLEAGDATLAWIGRLLAEHTRAVDVAFRIAGEEFAVLLPATDPEGAGIVARRLVELIAEARPPVPFDLNVTVSAGLAACPDHGRLPADLFDAAQGALAHAKEEGRNQVCVAGERVRAPARPSPQAPRPT